MVTLPDIRDEQEARIFPRHVLEGCETGLVLFAAAWYGKQDAVWLAEAGIRATCVDTNGGRLDAMALAYPDDWEFVVGDAFGYASRTRRRWDVVTVDCPTGAFDRCAGLAATWCGLARRVVVLGSGPAPELDLPVGWNVAERIRRSNFRGGTYWTVLQN